MVQLAEEEAKQPGDDTLEEEKSIAWEKRMDAAFASLGGFEMKDDGLVVQTGDCKQLRPPPFRKHRRIHSKTFKKKPMTQ